MYNKEILNGNKEEILFNYRFALLQYILSQNKDLVDNFMIQNIDFSQSNIINKRIFFILEKSGFYQKNISFIFSQEDYEAFKQEVLSGLYDKYLLPNYYIENTLIL